MQVAVLGAGAGGTALAGHLATRHSTVLWARDRALVESLSHLHENERYLRGITLPASLRYDPDLASALTHGAAEDALCVVAAPVAGLRALCRNMRESGIVPAHIVWLCKGFEADTQCLPNGGGGAELPPQRGKGRFA